MANFLLNELRPVGNELLDAQHRVIVGYLTKVYECVSGGNQERKLFVLAERLSVNCRLHFLEEETLLEEIRLPDLESHKAQHASFIAQLEQFTVHCEEWDQARCLEELGNLGKAFLRHVETFDSKYAELG